MNVASLPDVHLMERSPKIRIDKFKKTCLDKFKWCLETAKDQNCDALMIPGDLFDTALGIPSYEFVGEVLSLIRFYELPIVGIPGQHDLRYHVKGTKNTPFGLLESAGMIDVPSIKDPIDTEDGHKIYGCGWGQEDELKELISSGIDVSNDILLIHKMITKDKPLFPGQYDYMTAKAFLKKYPFKLVLSGDNHQRHWTQVKKQVLLNGGSMARLRKDQIDYHPRLHFINIETLSVSFMEIPIQEHVLDLSKVEEEENIQDRKNKVDDLISAIKKDSQRANFPTILHHVTKQVSPSKDVQDLLDDIIENAKKKMEVK